MLGYKVSFNIYKTFEITPCILSDHQGLMLVTNNNKNYNIIQTQENSLLNEKWFKTEIVKEITTFRN